jgi:tetratricopeptide (TPR) repeat protein
MAHQTAVASLPDMDSPQQDWNAVTGSPQPTKGPSEQDWARMRPRIIYLYIERNETCPEVQRALSREGFHATERMFKARFRYWGIDKKTIKDIEYEAMLMIYEAGQAAGEEIEFTVSHGQGRKSVTIAEIRKHLARAHNKNSQNQRHHRATLEREGYPYLVTRARKEIEFHVSFLHSMSNSPSPERSVSSSSGNDTYNSLPVNYPEVQRVPVDELAPSTSVPREAQTDCPPWRTVHITPMSASPVADLDLSPWFAQINLSSTSNEVHVVSHDAETHTAEQWAFHVFMIDILTDRNLDGSGWHREKALRYFKQMLLEDNRHLLTSMIHISAVLGSLGRYEAYKYFLIDCCKVMDDLNVPLDCMTPYRYALACELGDQAGIRQYSGTLEASTRHCQEVWGEFSPNVLASMHFEASYLLDQAGNVPEALKVLEVCLVQSNNVLQRYHSINIICLTLLARAYNTQGDTNHAIDLYTDAIERCKENPSIGTKHPYRLRFLRDLAVLQAQVGLFVDAERNLMEVLSGRKETLGPGHGDCWGATDDLKVLLCSQNRAHEWKCLQEELRRAYRENDKFISPREAYMP